MLNISHTKNTLVGDEFVRGVSGGERKRVSIAEMMATRARVQCWDNSTRGLDASTALDFVRSLRVMTDVLGQTTFITLWVQTPAYPTSADFSDIGTRPARVSTSSLTRCWCWTRGTKPSLGRLQKQGPTSKASGTSPYPVRRLRTISRDAPTRTNASSPQVVRSPMSQQRHLLSRMHSANLSSDRRTTRT